MVVKYIINIEKIILSLREKVMTKWFREWEMRNENEKWKWEMTIELWINKKTIFLISCQINI